LTRFGTGRIQRALATGCGGEPGRVAGALYDK
jgi:hypothetical protein